MSLIEVEGTVTAIGQSQFDNDVTIYAYIDVTGSAGGKTHIEKVAVFNDIGAALALGVSGTFYVDRIFRGASAIRCQLWGLRTEKTAVIDSFDLRTRLILYKLLVGIPTILFFGLGLLYVAEAIYLLATRGDRKRFFLGGFDQSPFHAQSFASRI